MRSRCVPDRSITGLTTISGFRRRLIWNRTSTSTTTGRWSSPPRKLRGQASREVSSGGRVRGRRASNFRKCCPLHPQGSGHDPRTGKATGAAFFLYLALSARTRPAAATRIPRQVEGGRLWRFCGPGGRHGGTGDARFGPDRLADNTLLIVTNDNGADWKVEDKGRFAHRANGDWRERRPIWDGGHRIPFLAAGAAHQRRLQEYGTGMPGRPDGDAGGDHRLSTPRQRGRGYYSRPPCWARKEADPRSRVHHSNLGVSAYAG